MNIMYASDDNYAEIMGVSILSLIRANSKIDEINFYIVQDSISQENLHKIREMINGNGRKVYFLDKPDIRGILGVDLLTLRWSDSAYSRLFLKEIFGENTKVEKLIYIDCDTLIVDSLQDVWDEDIDEYLGAGCLECMSNLHKKIIGAKKTDNYINTGFLVLNVKKWIDDNVQEGIVRFIRKYKGKTEYVDQGVINGTVSNQFKILSPKYNLTALAYDFTYEEMQIYRKPEFGYSKDEWEEAKTHPVVVHFTTSFISIRPWYEGSNHPYRTRWKNIHDASPWENQPYRTLNNKSSRDRTAKLYRILPNFIAIRIAGYLHAYLKPILYSLK